MKVRTNSDSSVIIIGAGVAGLAAGKMLQQAGFQVTILEAKNRFGGRIWTNRTLNGIPLDLGASWIHGEQGNPLTELADQREIERFASYYGGYEVYRGDGTIIPEREVNEISQLYEQIMSLVVEITEDSDSDIPLGQVIDQAVEELVGTLDAEESKILAYTINSFIEQDYAVDVEQLSAYYWDADQAFNGDDVLFPQGYDWLPNSLAEGLDIRLEMPVTSVDYSDDRVVIEAGSHTFEADYALVTVPLGVLKANQMNFNPPLPQNKQDAIDNLGMGVLSKLYLQFPEVFWDQDVEVVGYVDDISNGQWGLWLNYVLVVQQPVLLGFNGGDFGMESESMNDDELINSAMSVLRKIYGADIPDPIGFLRTQWSTDPYAFGSYSAYLVNSSPDDRDNLAKSINDKLFFAGEATYNDYPSTVHGALLSGQRAAKEMIELAVIRGSSS